MSVVSLTRSLRFRAAHHYGRMEWSAAENRRAFGENVTPHEHDYGIEVTVSGLVDPHTGFLVDLIALDGALEAVIGPLRGRNLAEVVPEVRDGMMPSTENLARWFFERLEPSVPPPAQLMRVRLSESDTLWAEFTSS